MPNAFSRYPSSDKLLSCSNANSSLPMYVPITIVLRPLCNSINLSLRTRSNRTRNTIKRRHRTLFRYNEDSRNILQRILLNFNCPSRHLRRHRCNTILTLFSITPRSTIQFQACPRSIRIRLRATNFRRRRPCRRRYTRCPTKSLLRNT